MEKYDIKKIIYIILLIATILSRNFILLILTGIFIILGEKNAKKDKLSKIDLKNNGEYTGYIIREKSISGTSSLMYWYDMLISYISEKNA